MVDSPPTMELRRESLDSEAARALIAELNAELTALYPEPGATHFRLGADEIAPGAGAFIVGYVAGAPVACGAVRKLDADVAEIKRMYVQPTWRGLGFSTRMLASLEDEARALGVKRIVLETGERQREALALYQRHGYRQVAPFGEYVGAPHSVCMEKML